jgi:DNA-directed RNA polymerase specialized sigma24 family protein
MTARLTLIDGPIVRREWEICRDSTLLGRDRRKCEVVLADRAVSRIHAEVLRHGDGFALVDRESRAGTQLNGCRLPSHQPAPLRTNDHLEICSCSLLFASDEGQSADVRPSDGGGSVTCWIRNLQDHGSDTAQEQLWNRYFRRLVGLARVKLAGTPRVVEDEEDVALHALMSFFDGARNGRFPRLADRQGLWQLLSRIVVCQAINQRNRALAQKRGAGRTQGKLFLDGSSDESAGMMDLASTEPTPEFLAEMAEQCRQLMSRLPDDLKQIAVWKLHGYTHAEIAGKIGRVERTVERKIQEIREIWSSGADT